MSKQFRSQVDKAEQAARAVEAEEEVGEVAGGAGGVQLPAAGRAQMEAAAGGVGDKNWGAGQRGREIPGKLCPPAAQLQGDPRCYSMAGHALTAGGLSTPPRGRLHTALLATSEGRVKGNRDAPAAPHGTLSRLNNIQPPLHAMSTVAALSTRLLSRRWRCWPLPTACSRQADAVAAAARHKRAWLPAS